MDAHVEVAEPVADRRKIWIASLITAVVIAVAIGLVAFRNSGDSGKSSGSGGSENAAAAAGAAAGSGEKNGEGKEKAPVPVSIATVGTAPISSYVTATANLVAENEVKVIAEAEGRIDQLLVEEGRLVRKGDPLVMLVRGDAQMAVEKARVRAANAKVSFDRASDMFAKGLLSQGDFDKTKMENDVAAQELAEAQWRLGKTVVRAPFDGQITLREVDRGQHVRPGDSLFTITDFDPLVARIYLPEKDVMSLEPGRPVRLTLRAAPEIKFTGRIRQISPVVDTNTGTVKVTVEAVNAPSSVRPGAFVSVDIVRETQSNATVLPRQAVLRELRESHVFIANGTTAQRRVVTLGIEEGGFVQAVSGVKPGEKVIVAGQGGLKDGSPIKILETES